MATGFAKSVCGTQPRMHSSFASTKNARRVQRSRAVNVKAVIEEPTVRYKSQSKSDTSTVLAVILGGGAGSRLYPLTKLRAKPAVPIGGAYRLIDVPMSNCINSGVSKIYILTQFNSTSLNRHLARTYNMGSGVRFGGDGFVEVLAATQTPTQKDWFAGTADAIRQYAWVLQDVRNRPIEDVVILSGDHLYRQDYMEFVEYHREKNADITVACLACDRSRASDFGLMKINDESEITEFAEKPKGEALDRMAVDTTILGLDAEEAKEKPFIASMGIYVFKKQKLLELLTEKYPNDNDFGGEILPKSLSDSKVVAFLHNGYWEDIGTIKSFFDANLALAKQPADFEFYDPQSPIYTSSRFLPPAKIENSKVTDAIISHGVYLRQCTVNNAIVGVRSRVNKGSVIQDAMIMGADYYESDEQRAALAAEGKVPLGIGENSLIANTIVDKNARIGKNCKIINKDGVNESIREDEGIYIRSGIVVVLKDATIPDGTIV